MSGIVQERFSPLVVPVDGTVDIPRNSIGCFLAATAGAITITVKQADVKPAYTLVSALAVTAGQFIRLPFYLGSNGGAIVASGGASGILGVI